MSRSYPSRSYLYQSRPSRSRPTRSYPSIQYLCLPGPLNSTLTLGNLLLQPPNVVLIYS